MTGEIGSTAGTAIPVEAKDSIEGIGKEFTHLERMFGTRERDWKVVDRTTVNIQHKTFDRFVLSVNGARRKVYFDISSFITKNDTATKLKLKEIIDLYDRQIGVLLPREEMLTLFTGVLHLNEEQLEQIGLSAAERLAMIEPLSKSISRWRNYEDMPEHITVTALVSVWSNILGILKVWKPNSMLQEAEIENLKAIVQGSLKSELNKR